VIAAATAWSLGGPEVGLDCFVAGLLSRVFVFMAPVSLSEPAAMLLAAAFFRGALSGGRDRTAGPTRRGGAGTAGDSEKPREGPGATPGAGHGLAAAALLFWFRPLSAAVLIVAGLATLPAIHRRGLMVGAAVSCLALVGFVSLTAGELVVSPYSYVGEGLFEPGFSVGAAIRSILNRILWSLADTAPFLSPILVLYTLAAGPPARDARLVALVWIGLNVAYSGRLTGDTGFAGGRHLSTSAPLVLVGAAVALVQIARCLPLERVRGRPWGVYLPLGLLACLQLAAFDLPVRLEAMRARERADPLVALARDGVGVPDGRLLVLCRTEHYDPSEPGRRHDAYFLAFHCNDLDASGPVVFARQRDEGENRRLARALGAGRVVRLEWRTGPQGPEARVIDPGPSGRTR
jgi:hypothetical protein